MDAALEAAFRSTHYHVLAPAGEFVLLVDVHSEPLRQLLHSAGQPHAAVLTAFNPGALRRAAAANCAAQEALRQELVALGCTVVAARNVDPRGEWPVETSVLVPGLPEAQARRLAAHHGQLAYLWCTDAGTARLIETATGQ
ncbi:MAG: DUF3293 domain-containing protein [Steroidobacteraceae bacterium]